MIATVLLYRINRTLKQRCLLRRDEQVGSRVHSILLTQLKMTNSVGGDVKLEKDDIKFLLLSSSLSQHEVQDISVN